MEVIIVLGAKIVYAAACILIIIAVLLQEGKGGGLAALGGTRAETAFGSSNPLRRMTVILAIIMFLLGAGLSYYLGRGQFIGGYGVSTSSAEEESKAPTGKEGAPEKKAPVEGAESGDKAKAGAGAEKEPGGATEGKPEGAGKTPAAGEAGAKPAEPEPAKAPGEAPAAPAEKAPAENAPAGAGGEGGH